MNASYRPHISPVDEPIINRYTARCKYLEYIILKDILAALNHLGKNDTWITGPRL